MSDEKIARLRAARLARDAGRQGADRMPDYPVLSMGDVLRFGKHEGKSVEDVLESDPGWLRWAIENVRGFEVSGDVESELHALNDPRRPAHRDR